MKQLRIHLWARGLHMERVQDTEVVAPCALSLARLLVVRGGGDKLAHEQTIALEEFNLNFETLCSDPIWIDADQDNVEEDAEIDDYSANQLMGSERAI
jgi:hypothetical protein